MNRCGKYILASIFVIWMLDTAHAAEKSGTVKTQSVGTFQVKFSDGYVSLNANEAAVANIFEEISKQAGITIENTVGPEEKITIHFDRLELEEGIKRLAKNVMIFYTQDRKDKTPWIARVVVLSEGKDTPGQAKTSPQPAKAKEPAPKSEPFKFEFDPGKFAEKQKPRKQQ